jgi:hypothetical protein
MLNKEHERAEDSKSVPVPSTAGSWDLRWTFEGHRYYYDQYLDQANDTFPATPEFFLMV